MTDHERTLSEVAVREALAVNGIQDHHDGMHSWRCEYPDRYPDVCTCVNDLVSDLMPLLAAEREAGRREGAARALREAADALHQFSERDDGLGGYLCTCGEYRWAASEPHCPVRGELLARAEREGA